MADVEQLGTYEARCGEAQSGKAFVGLRPEYNPILPGHLQQSDGKSKKGKTKSTVPPYSSLMAAIDSNWIDNLFQDWRCIPGFAGPSWKCRADALLNRGAWSSL